jgi:uncharacterized protein YdcH (DUF465 family)
MPVLPQQVREHLMASNPEFQRLAQEHSRYETQLEQLTEQPYLSSEDLILETTLKKLKLRVKDEMEMLVRQHERLGAHG